ncbi:MAG TPA: response regulator [Acidobacteriota bacterium]|nr:response regulator [Acidobacteriota bacterium]
MTDDYRPTVLIVDDEEIVTISLRNLFRLQTTYQVIAHTSPKEALAAAHSAAVDLVITDYLMPEMDGITFLSTFKETQPQAIRVLLTGYADKENAIRAINSVGLYQYIEKPWDNDKLLMVVKNGLEKRALVHALESKIAELDQAHSSLKSLQTELIKAFM